MAGVMGSLPWTACAVRRSRARDACFNPAVAQRVRECDRRPCAVPFAALPRADVPDPFCYKSKCSDCDLNECGCRAATTKGWDFCEWDESNKQCREGKCLLVKEPPAAGEVKLPVETACPVTNSYEEADRTVLADDMTMRPLCRPHLPTCRLHPIVNMTN